MAAASAPAERGGQLSLPQWRVLGGVAAMVGAYAALCILSVIPGLHAAPGSAAHRAYLIGEAAFELALTVALGVALQRTIGACLARPLRDTQALLRMLAELTDAREHAVYDHSHRVALLARDIARSMGLAAAEAETVSAAALIHDIGKIGVPDRILLKPGPLDPQERRTMMAHAALGATLVRRTGPLAALARLIRHHHEWWNGRGYPDGLAGEAIPLGARIIAVADALDTMTTGRPYRVARPVADALAELEERAGSQFQPAVVAAARSALGAQARVVSLPHREPADRARPATLAEQDLLERVAAV